MFIRRTVVTSDMETNRKGINPVLATVILIAITLIAAIAIAGFVFGLFGAFTNQQTQTHTLTTCPRWVTYNYVTGWISTAPTEGEYPNGTGWVHTSGGIEHTYNPANIAGYGTWPNGTKWATIAVWCPTA